MSRDNQRPWVSARNEPTACFQHPDGNLKSDRPLAGPLRLGTEPRVGPKGALRVGSGSDFGMDRITPLGFDPMGSHNTRQPEQEKSSLISREIRRGKGGKGVY